MRMIIFCLLAISLFGCEESNQTQSIPETHIHVLEETKTIHGYMSVIHDDKRNVTCWILGFSPPALSCLPDKNQQVE